jgi:hypothetical protein
VIISFLSAVLAGLLGYADRATNTGQSQTGMPGCVSVCLRFRPSIDAMAIACCNAKLRQEGFGENVKIVERLYSEERLALRRRSRKKIPKGVREGAWCPVAANQRWSPDFTMDAVANGRKFRTANLKYDCTRECPAIDVAQSLPGSRVVEMAEL